MCVCVCVITKKSQNLAKKKENCLAECVRLDG